MIVLVQDHCLPFYFIHRCNCTLTCFLRIADKLYKNGLSAELTGSTNTAVQAYTSPGMVRPAIANIPTIFKLSSQSVQSSNNLHFQPVGYSGSIVWLLHMIRSDSAVRFCSPIRSALFTIVKIKLYTITVNTGFFRTF